MGRLVAFAVGLTVGLIARNTVPWQELRRAILQGGRAGARAAAKRLPAPAPRTPTPSPQTDTGAGMASDTVPHDDYTSWSRDALYEHARALGIKGRSRMSKAALIEAVRRAEVSSE